MNLVSRKIVALRERRPSRGAAKFIGPARKRWVSSQARVSPEGRKQINPEEAAGSSASAALSVAFPKAAYFAAAAGLVRPADFAYASIATINSLMSLINC